MSDLRALFKAVLAAPSDDAPRLVYADALTEHDDPRGEFITVQCKLAVGRSSPQVMKQLRAREAELLAAHREEWFGPVEKWLRQNDAYGLSQLKVHRGFVMQCRVQVTGPDTLHTLFEKAPLLERLLLRGGPTELSPCLPQLTHLDAEGECAESVVQGVSARALPRLTQLRLEFGYGAKPGQRLELSQHPNLEVFELTRASQLIERASLPGGLVRLTWPGLTKPEVLSGLPALRSLRLGWNELPTDFVDAVLGVAPQLERLEVSSRNRGGLGRLLGGEFSNLTHLDLSGTSLGAQGVAWVTALRAPKLRSLDLTNASITSAGAKALLGSKLVKHLDELSLRSNRLTDADLAGAERLTHLSLLNLKKNKVTPGFLKSLQKALGETKLTR